MPNLKEKLNQKTVMLGTMLSEVYTPNIARVMKAGGMEFIIVDCEHGYFDFSQMANIISVCNGFHLPVIIRVPTNGREVVTKSLDMGADGLLIPMVNCAEDIKQVVKYAKYAPMGIRGISTTRAHTNYSPPTLSEYIKAANERTIILAQIETSEALLNAEEIASVDGVDALIIGPNDLAMDMGTPGNFESDDMKNAVETVVLAAKKANKPCGIVASNIKFLHQCRNKGMTIFSCNSEVGMIMESAKQIGREFHG
jgi:4-hydroxy-2-oxoheptanedioate aldolase